MKTLIRSGFKPAHITALLTLCIVAPLLAYAPARDAKTEPAGKVRFAPVHIYADPGGKPLAAYQFELVCSVPVRAYPDSGRDVTRITHQGATTNGILVCSVPVRASIKMNPSLSLRGALRRSNLNAQHGRLLRAACPEPVEWARNGIATIPEGRFISLEAPRAYSAEEDNASRRHYERQVKIVGVEGGEHPAFAEAPYYDPAALMNDRIIIAAFNTGKNLPTARTRIATIHLQIPADAEPEYQLELVTAADADGSETRVKLNLQKGDSK